MFIFNPPALVKQPPPIPPEPFKLSNAIYDTYRPLSAFPGFPSGFRWVKNGYAVWVHNRNIISDSISFYEYAATTPYDITTVGMSPVNSASFTIGALGSFAIGLDIVNDNNILLTGNNLDDWMACIVLDTDGDLDSGYTVYSTSADNIVGAVWNDDGSKIIASNVTSNKTVAYNCATNYRPDTASLDTGNEWSWPSFDIHGMWRSPDGLTYIGFGAFQGFIRFELSVKDDLTTAVYKDEYIVNDSYDANYGSIECSDSGDRLWMTDGENDRFYTFILPG